MSSLLWLLLLSSNPVSLHAAPAKLAPWTTTLRDRQPADAFAAVYKVGAKRLVFLGAQHANRADSLTFKLIQQAYQRFAFDTVIAEGFPTSRGANPPRLFKYVAENGPRPDGFVGGGETVPTVVGAQAQRAALWGGEADDLAIKTRLLAIGFSGADLLGFYVLRNIPQWIGEQKIENAGDSRLCALVTEALAKNRGALQLAPTVLPTFEDWAAWYQARNNRPIGAGFVTEEVGPLADGKFASNRIAYALSRERDAYLHKLIVTHLNSGQSVLVVFGESHLMIHKPALDAVLGRPCYVGADLARAAVVCRK